MTSFGGFRVCGGEDNNKETTAQENIHSFIGSWLRYLGASASWLKKKIKSARHKRKELKKKLLILNILIKQLVY